MKPENRSNNLLSITRARAKMHEYNVPSRFFNRMPQSPEELLLLTIGILGDFNNRSRSESVISIEEKSSMLFSAQFFDAFLNSRLNQSISNYLLLLGSSAYYLCDLPGSSKVLINRLSPLFPELNGDGLEFLLIGLLRNSFYDLPILRGQFSDEIIEIINLFEHFFNHGIGDEDCLEACNKLREELYLSGTDRQLLLVDTVISVMDKRFKNSSWKLLPEFTNSTIDDWREVIAKADFIKEFWPAQILLGKHDVFKGQSAVVQMPTSAGKTRSIELILRASFTAKEHNLAVIVAPFKALCNEIKQTLQTAFTGERVRVDAPSDAFQVDFDWFSDNVREEEKFILVLTPEKFLYMLRQSPEIANDIGLLVYDEGHQFDNGIRGVTYELLLSSLRLAVSPTTQIILISAVIQNAPIIGEWLIGNNCEIINGQDLLPTYRTIGFASWNRPFGRIEYVQPGDPDTNDFYVPRVLQESTLNKLGRERKDRLFPEKDDSNSIAIYLGLKLIHNGALAIFCGSKPTVNTISEKIKDLVEREYTETWPSYYSNSRELKRLKFLHKAHFGRESILTQNCEVGVFAHSGNTPQGLRLCIEYAMQQGRIRFLICTSTLAQGVNLPIKYLMVNSFYQAREKIKTRDFHNLIGRAGRSGIHTEGSVLFTDPEIYDGKTYRRNSYTWGLAKDLLDPSLSEPCSSTILHLFDPIYSGGRRQSLRIDINELAEAYIEGEEGIESFVSKVYRSGRDLSFEIADIRAQIRYKVQIFAAIESYLLAHWESNRIDQDNTGISKLVEATLAYKLAGDEHRDELISLFEKLTDRVSDEVSSVARKSGFGKTLLGVTALLKIESWVNQHEEELVSVNDELGLFQIIWPLLNEFLSHKNLNKLFPENSRLELARSWINGESYEELLNSLISQGSFVRANTQERKVTQDIVVDIVDGAFGYDSTLIIAAIVEILSLRDDETFERLISILNFLQKKLKYGLPSDIAIAFYEQGFADRVLAQELAITFPLFTRHRIRLTKEIKINTDAVWEVLRKYPTYFHYVLENL